MAGEISIFQYWLNTARKFFRSSLPIACLLTLFLNFLWVPSAVGQTAPSRFVDRLFELSGGILQLRPATTVFRRGNLEYSYVTFDGYSLFPLAVEAPLPGAQASETEASLRPVVQRVEYFENNLRQVVALEYLPFQLEVTAELVGEELVIFVSDSKTFVEQRVGLVTEEDALLLGQEIDELAEERVKVVRKALIRARAERKLNYLQAQALKGLAIALVTLASSLILMRVQRVLLKRMKQSLQSHPLPKWPKSFSHSSDMSELQDETLDLLLNSHIAESRSDFSTKQRLNAVSRYILRTIQVAIWLGGIVWFMMLFPYSRDLGLWLLNLPVRLLLFILFVILVKRAIDFFINSMIWSWVDRNIYSGVASRRHIKRAPSLSTAYKTLTQTVAILAISVMVLFELLRLPTITLVTAVGVIGFAAQSIIKDLLNGCFILWEDQYAIGDIVTINDFTGYVEYIGLRITKVRSLDGELITIANHTIDTACNLTNQWSRLNLGIDVAYGTDLDKAISVINEVAQNLKEDAAWEELILEPPLVLGVDGFGDNSITIRLLITTRPMRQWDVGREYRLRIKKAFDEVGITIPYPQRSLWIENSLPFKNSRNNDIESTS